MTRVGEEQAQLEILKLLADGRVWTNQELKTKLERILPLSGEDKAASKSRPAEPRWHNIVNNALSNERQSSLHGVGAVESVGLGFHQITDSGRQLLARRISESQMWSDAFDRIFPEHDAKG